MYLAQSVEEWQDKGVTKHQLYVWRVELDAGGRPVWKLHRKGYWCRGYMSMGRGMCRKRGEKNVPFMQDAAHGKLVTMRQAETLTGYLRPAALDYLTEQVQNTTGDAVYYLQNYVKPKPVKESSQPEPVAPLPPTRAELARKKQTRAEAKVGEWESAATHATAKAKEWARKAKRHASRAAKLEAEEKAGAL